MSNPSPEFELFDGAAARLYCGSRLDAREDWPFGPDVLVFKVGGKIFALLNFNDPAELSLKCDPDRAEILRELYPAIVPGYHLNKRHWNTVTLDGSVPAAECVGLIDHSYELVAPKKKRQKSSQ